MNSGSFLRAMGPNRNGILLGSKGYKVTEDKYRVNWEFITSLLIISLKCYCKSVSN